MATGGREDDPASDLAVASGSEAIFDHVCQPCSDENIKEAIGFCENCAEWLCDECFRIHTKPKPSKHHVLRDLEEMKNSISPLRPTDKCTERCDQHNGKRLKYYCSIHELFGCSLCVIQSHTTCKVDHIPDVCESTDIKEEFQEVTTKLEAIAKISVDIKSEANEQKELIRINATETDHEIQSFIRKLIESIQDIGTSLGDTFESKAKEEIVKLENISKVCDDVEKESSIMKARLENLQNTGQHCNAYVTLKRSKSNLATLEGKQKQLSVTTRMHTFLPNLTLESTITGREGIGSLTEQDIDYSKIKAQHVADISIKTPGNGTSEIIGATLLSPDKLVLADCERQIKVVDTKTNTLVTTYKVNGRPRDISKASDNAVVTTLWVKQQLLFLSVGATGAISEMKSIPVDGHCMGVAMLDDKMIVTFVYPTKIEIMDSCGKVLQTLTYPTILDFPTSVAVNPDKTLFYVTNSHKYIFACVNLDGKLIAKYKDDVFRGPGQAVVDHNGMVYVTGSKSNNVHLLTPDCKKVKVILSAKDGVKGANAVSYCKKTRRLFVGMDFSDVIKVFQLK